MVYGCQVIIRVLDLCWLFAQSLSIQWETHTWWLSEQSANVGFLFYEIKKIREDHVEVSGIISLNFYHQAEDGKSKQYHILGVMTKISVTFRDLKYADVMISYIHLMYQFYPCKNQMMLCAKMKWILLWWTIVKIHETIAPVELLCQIENLCKSRSKCLWVHIMWPSIRWKYHFQKQFKFTLTR